MFITSENTLFFKNKFSNFARKGPLLFQQVMMQHFCRIFFSGNEAVGKAICKDHNPGPSQFPLFEGEVATDPTYIRLDFAH